MSVDQDLRPDGILVLSVNYPPVNALGQAVRQGLANGISHAVRSDAKGVVICCEGRTFMAGADIREFGAPPMEPHLPDLVAAIEACPVPVVAAIHGSALGGGLEVALGCHGRVATADAKLGLPEVNLGLIPGAGGTQRLPRLAGVEVATDIITSGKAISAIKALESGLIDRTSEGDLLQDALDLVRELASSVHEQCRISEYPSPVAPNDFFAATRATLATRRRGFEAPQACVDAIEAACTLPFEEGIKRERELFLKCKNSLQSSAQRHMFFAERSSMRVEDLDKTISPLPLQKVAVIGAGIMGTGIAVALADAGLQVTLLEINATNLEAGMSRIKDVWKAAVEKGRISEHAFADRWSRVAGTTTYASLADADLVIEAAFERMDVKQSIFAELDKVTRPDCILATNTSYLDVDGIARTVADPSRVLGLHFFSPANIMKLLEIVRARETSKTVLQTALALSKRLGKIGVVSGVCHGFIGNRMYQHYQREVGLLLLQGASPKQIDKAIRDFGFAMGPCSVADLSGLDIGYQMRKSLDETQYEARAFKVHDQLVEMNRLGQKTGGGFYDYHEGSRRGQASEQVARIIRQVASSQGIEQSEIDDNEIIDRCMFALVSAGAKIIDEGIAARPSDIDVVLVNGYGFPRWRGGPMHWAETTGYDTVMARITEFASEHGERWWKPAKWLRDQGSLA